MAGETIYHLAHEADWARARAGVPYHGAADCRRDGFIHFSTAAQLAGSAARHRPGARDLVLVAVDAARLGPALRWEPGRNGALFPHLYGPLPMAAVIETVPLTLGPDGRHRFPPHIAEAG
jgi:uncharacterized protein (DUF952 family)